MEHDIGTCKYYVSPEQEECGQPAVTQVKTRVGVKGQAFVPLCATHKRIHDENNARMRAARKQSRDHGPSTELRFSNG